MTEANLGAAVTVSKPSGLIEHAMKAWRDWRANRRRRSAERHYSSVLNAGLVEVWIVTEVINE